MSSASTKTTTLHLPEVEACLNRHLLGVRCPAPKGGGIVIVSYPLAFTTD